MDLAVGHGLTPTGLVVVVEEQPGVRALPLTTFPPALSPAASHCLGLTSPSASAVL